MTRKSVLKSAVAAVLLALPTVAHSTTTVPSGDIQVTAVVDQFAEWGPAVPVNIATHITAVNQTQTGTANQTLYTNVTVGIAATTTAGTPDFGGILTDSSHTYTLTTQYKLTGAALTVGASIYETPAAFFADNWTLTHTAGNGSYTLQLDVSATSAAASAPEADTYTCGIQLTATW